VPIQRRTATRGKHEWIEVGAKRQVRHHRITPKTPWRIVFVELPKPGSKVERGKVFGSVESAEGCLRPLLAGDWHRGSRSTKRLATAPEKINADAHGRDAQGGDLPTPPKSISYSMPQAYEKFVTEETH